MSTQNDKEILKLADENVAPNEGNLSDAIDDIIEAEEDSTQHLNKQPVIRYYLRDYKAQARMLTAQVSFMKAFVSPERYEEIVSDMLAKCRKRIGKHYGLYNKYRGDGTKKTYDEKTGWWL